MLGKGWGLGSDGFSVRIVVVFFLALRKLYQACTL